MRTNYLYDYVSSMERILSSAYKLKYSLDAVEKYISNSAYFKNVEKDKYYFTPVMNDDFLVESLFGYIHVDLSQVPVYSQTSWASEAYIRIQENTHLTFEAIFLYIPIKEMYDLYPVYHEMDFLHLIDLFKKRFKEKSVLELLLNKYKISLSVLSKQLNISYSTLFSLKKRRRDIQTANLNIVVKLANQFKVRIETIGEIVIEDN